MPSCWMMFQLLKWRWIAGASDSASGRRISRRVCNGRRNRNYFWHFGHQKVERPFWVKRLTMPLHLAVWHFSPSRS